MAPTVSAQTMDIDEAPELVPEAPVRSTKGMSRYATIIISVALFLVFDMGVLVLNFFISAQIAEDAVAVNLAGRQRMLSQRTMKTLLLTESNAERGGSISEPLKELNLTVTLFDSTLKAFDTGGSVTGTAGGITDLPPADTPKGESIVAEALEIWGPYATLIAKATSSGVLDREALGAAIDYGVANNLKLLKLMNDLTNERESVAAERATNLRMIQAAGIGLALINFVIILFHFIRKLRDADSETERYAVNLEQSNDNLTEAKSDLEAAKRQTDEILETVNEGLFLIDADGLIGDQYSQALESIFPEQKLAGQTLANLLRPMLGDKDYAMTLDYLPLLFQARLKEKMLLNVNPLEEVEVNMLRGSGTQLRVLSFAFNRVYDGRDIRHILVSVHDVTDKVMLARELEASQERARE
ncbi:MAG: type IV pili methyl-accepting chemotaxis transducer N-terminal domain-containing protein, partial [Gammaproteobacteria bacterium]